MRALTHLFNFRTLVINRVATMRLAVLLLAFIFCCTSIRAADASSDFEQANKCYEQGKYADAVSLYEKMLKQGNASAAVYFNRGNAYFKMGQLGHAIASYRQAEQLAPRDPELRANLQFVRKQAQGGASHSSERWRTYLNWLTLNEWTWATVIAFWILFLLLAGMQWKPELRARLRNPTIFAATAFVLFGICLAISLNEDYFTKSAIVVASEVDVHNGPLDESQASYKVKDGAELTILDQKDGWYQVSDPSQRVGWVRQDQVLVFSPKEAGKSKA
jgi:tetratricopeptide (TPR) repeat protein